MTRLTSHAIFLSALPPVAKRLFQSTRVTRHALSYGAFFPCASGFVLHHERRGIASPISVPPPKKDILKRVFAIIIKYLPLISQSYFRQRR